MAEPAENQCYVVEDFLTFPYQPTCFQLRSQSFSCKSSSTSPRSMKEVSRRRGPQEQSQSFTFRSEGEGSSRRQLGQSYDLLNQGSRSKEDRQESLPVRRRLQELVPRDGEGSGWERLQSIRRRLQEKRRRQEKENVEETMLRQEEEDKTESGWVLDESRGQLRRGETVRDEDFEDDFEMREGREMRRQLMRSTSLTAPLSLRPAFARTSSFTPNRRQPPSGGLKTDLFSSSLPFRPSSISNGSLTPSSMYSSLSPESSGASTPSSSKSTDSENFWNQYRRSPPPISIPDMLRGLLKGKLRWQP